MQAMKYFRVSHIKFYESLSAARSERLEIYKSLAIYPLDRYADMRTFLSEDHRSGYAITIKNKLVSVFSIEKGRGDELVEDAKLNGVKYLKAFDGYLPGFYARHGFQEVSREANWFKDGPQVITMKLEAL